jgi:hypothetical protein
MFQLSAFGLLKSTIILRKYSLCSKEKTTTQRPKEKGQNDNQRCPVRLDNKVNKTMFPS